MIEFKALKLLNFLRKRRNEVVTCMRFHSNIDTGSNPRLYKRSEQFDMRDVSTAEKQQKGKIDRKVVKNIKDI